MAQGSHHMFAFYQNGATDGSVAPCPEGGLTFGAFTFTAQAHQVTQTYPSMVGATIPAGTGFNMMVHYLNTGSTTIQSHVALTMYVAKPNVVTLHAGVIFLNNAGISIAANSTQTATSSFMLPQNVSIMYSDAHMHNRATLFTATAGSQTLYTTTEWQEPPALAYSPPLQLSAGTSDHVVVRVRQQHRQHVDLRRVGADQRDVHLDVDLLSGLRCDQSGPRKRDQRHLLENVWRARIPGRGARGERPRSPRTGRERLASANPGWGARGERSALPSNMTPTSCADSCANARG